MEFNIEVKYNNIIYVKVSEVLENNKKLGYTKKALKELLDLKSITIKGMGRTKYINKDYILNSIIKSPSDTEDDDDIDKTIEDINKGFEEAKSCFEDAFKQMYEGIGEQFKIINNINYTKDEYDRSKIFRKTLINKYHPDKGGKTGDIDLINKIFENVNCVEEYK